MGKRARILIAKPGLDGHDVGAKVVARALMDAGFEVIYTGLRQTPEMIATAARDEDVDLIGLSILSGSHLPICKRLRALLAEYGIEEKPVVIGGNIPKRDHARLAEIGVDRVFPVGSDLAAIVAYVREKAGTPA